MNLEQVVKSFAGPKRGHGIERHSIKSLSKRLLTSRQTVRKMLKGGELPWMASLEAGKNTSYTFSSVALDMMRQSLVEEMVREIAARLQGLDMSEQELVLTALHGLRAHKADIENEFSSKPNDDDDDESTAQEVAKLIGGSAGAAGGVLAGTKLVGGLSGALAGGALGAAAGRSLGGSEHGGDVAAGLAGAGLGVAGHRLIQARGGYRAVAAAARDSQAIKEAGGRVMAALRRAAAKAAAAV